MIQEQEELSWKKFRKQLGQGFCFKIALPSRDGISVEPHWIALLAHKVIQDFYVFAYFTSNVGKARTYNLNPRRPGAIFFKIEELSFESDDPRESAMILARGHIRKLPTEWIENHFKQKKLAPPRRKVSEQCLCKILGGLEESGYFPEKDMLTIKDGIYLPYDLPG